MMDFIKDFLFGHGDVNMCFAWATALPYLIPAAVEAGKTIFGINQSNKGAEMRKNLKYPLIPEYNVHYNSLIPENISKGVDTVGRGVNVNRNAFLDTTLPGQGVAENKISGNVAQGINAAISSASSPAEIMAAIVGLNKNQNDATNTLATKAAEQQLIDQNNYANSLTTLGNAEIGLGEYQGREHDKEFQYNELGKYQHDMKGWEAMLQKYMLDSQASAGVEGAGIQNIFGGLSGIASAITGGITASGSANNMDKYFQFLKDYKK